MMAVPITEAAGRAHRNPFRVRWEVSVYKADGTLKEQKSGENSLVAGFAFIVWSLLVYQDAGFTEHDITNTLRSAYSMFPGGSGVYTGVLVGDSTSTPDYFDHGIQVGTNNTAVTADDYKLNTIVAHGFAAGQLLRMPCFCNAVITDATTSSFTIDRVFLNHSAGTITIKELGIYGRTSLYTWCLARDIIGDPGVDIDDGEYMHVRYTISVTEA